MYVKAAWHTSASGQGWERTCWTTCPCRSFWLRKVNRGSGISHTTVAFSGIFEGSQQHRASSGNITSNADVGVFGEGMFLTQAVEDPRGDVRDVTKAARRLTFSVRAPINHSSICLVPLRAVWQGSMSVHHIGESHGLGPFNSARYGMGSMHRDCIACTTCGFGGQYRILRLSRFGTPSKRVAGSVHMLPP